MWHVKTFNELTIYELHQIYYLRVAVFVVEQNCAYQEVDELDLASSHLYEEQDGKIVAYARLIPETDKVRLGRVIVHPDYRKQQKGQALLQEAIAYSNKHWPGLPLHAGAQAHLEKFYGAFDFQTVSEVYLEDDIPHIDMVRPHTEQAGEEYE